MKTFANDACSRWLADRGIVEAPYGRLPYQAPWYKQFPLSHAPQHVSYICRCMVEVTEPFSEALLHVTDWSLYQPDEMAVVSTLRAAHGEQRPLIESPGHLFTASKRDLLIGMLSLVACYHWSAYLYFDHRTTLLCWEGDLLDFWTFEHSRIALVTEALQPHEVLLSKTGNI